MIAAAEALGYRPNAMARAVTHAALGRGRDRDARRHGGLLSRGAGPCRADAEQSTQAAFGRMLFQLARSDHPLADRIVTTSPDVTVSTNLDAWVNRRGLFRRKDVADVFAAARIPSAQKWSGGGAGQHIELGIAEHKLFPMLAAAGLAGPLFGTRLLPIGTVYDPFIARGLDALNYAAYMNSRFLLVATPSGVTLGPDPARYKGRRVGLILCGGNIDDRLLTAILRRQQVRDGTLFRLVVQLPDRAGSLGRLCAEIGRMGGNIDTVVHDRSFLASDAKSARVEVEVELADPLLRVAMERALGEQGFVVDGGR